jgi:hypothetical protein
MRFSGEHATYNRNAASPRFFLPLHGFYSLHTFGEIIMTMFQRKRIQLIKEAIDKKNATTDADVDSLLERFIASKWTGAVSAAVLLAAVVFVIAAVWSLF